MGRWKREEDGEREPEASHATDLKRNTYRRMSFQFTQSKGQVENPSCTLQLLEEYHRCCR